MSVLHTDSQLDLFDTQVESSPISPDLGDINRAMKYTFDPVMYSGQSSEYRLDYMNKIIYYVLEVVVLNPNITINQVCGLLRNTIQLPEELTRSAITTVLNTLPPESRVLKVYESAKEVKHLSVTSHCAELVAKILEKFPELEEYVAPVYVKRKREENISVVSAHWEVN